MAASPSAKRAIGVSIAAAVVFIGAFLPWGEVSAGPTLDLPGGSAHLPLFSATMTGWNGHITVLGMKIPNWLVVVVAVAAAGLCWLRTMDVWPVSTTIPAVLAGYGLLHAGWVVVVLGASGRGSVGIGAIVVALAFVGMLVAVLKQDRVLSAGAP